MQNINYNEYHIRALLLRDDIDFNKFTKLELIDFLNVSRKDNEELKEKNKFLMERENKLQTIEHLFKTGEVDLAELTKLVMEDKEWSYLIK